MPSNAASSISGPTNVSGSRGSPIFTFANSCFSRATSRSAMLSWTMSRRSVVQRCPAVPAAENRIARSASARSADGQTIIALLPPSSSSTRPNLCATRGPTARPIAVEPVAETSAIRGSSTSCSPTSRPPWTSWTRPSGASPNRSQRAAHERHDGFGGERRLLARLPDDRIAADQRQRRIPGPDRDREVEGADDQHRPERMPLLHHPVVGPLAGDGQAVELARQADREVADVDHLLDLAEALLDDLAAFQRDQPGQRLLRRAQFLAKQPDELAAPRRGNGSPRVECCCSRRRCLRRIARADTPDLASVDRREARQGRRRDASTPSCLRIEAASSAGLMRNSSLARAMAATPASIVSSRLAKHSRTRWRDGFSSAKAETGTVATPARSTAAVAKVSSSDVESGRLQVDAQEIGRGRFEHLVTGLPQGPRSFASKRAKSAGASARSRRRPAPCPKATAACRFGAVAKVRNWWARAATAAFSGEATIQPTFQPVSENILPAEPAFRTRSAIPGKRRERSEAARHGAGHAPRPRR